MSTINGIKIHNKLMEEACENFTADMEQVRKLYELIIREITNKSSKKAYKELYNKEYLKNIEDKVNQKVLEEIEISYGETIYDYLKVLSNRIANKKLIINYINFYGEDLAKVLTEKYLLAYQKDTLNTFL